MPTPTNVCTSGVEGIDAWIGRVLESKKDGMVKPDIWIQECTPRFDMSLFRMVLGELYNIQQRCLSPTDMGWPVSRKRQWSIGVLKSKLKVVVELNDFAFDEIFCREVESKCDVFFQDSIAHRREAMQELRRPSERRFE
eukprot:6453217-Amphidinium_carterae.1